MNLVIGLSAMFNMSQDHCLLPQWQSCIGLEYGKLVLQQQLAKNENILHWGNFGNLRHYILESFQKMGFSNKGPIDWKNVVVEF